LFREDLEETYYVFNSPDAYLGGSKFHERLYAIQALYNIGDVSAVDSLMNSFNKFPITNIENEVAKENVEARKRKIRDATLMALLHLDMENPNLSYLTIYKSQSSSFM
jgi:HEAT repeat protein